MSSSAARFGCAIQAHWTAPARAVTATAVTVLASGWRWERICSLGQILDPSRIVAGLVTRPSTPGSRPDLHDAVELT